MTFKTKLLAGVALVALTAGSALADSNNAELIQNGANNSASADQSGNSNQTAVSQNGDRNDFDVEQAGNGNIAARAFLTQSQAIVQDGDDNDIDIVQDGNTNRVATEGFRNDQIGDNNVLDVEQSSNANTLGEFRQDSSASTGGTNTLTILQTSGDRNSVKRSFQTNDGASDNTASVTQTGTRNFVQDLVQDGSGNSAALSFSGDRNGTNGVGTGNPVVGALTGASAISGALASSVQQTGTNNEVGLNISGDDNQFGVTQAGSMNKATNFALTGNSNLLGVGQYGDDNIVNLGTINGDRNDVGVLQNGPLNVANIDLLDTASDNTVQIDQLAEFSGTNTATVKVQGGNATNGGDNNEITLLQKTNNTIGVDVTGDRNDVNSRQFGNNDATITIDGDFEGDDNVLDVFQSDGGFGRRNTLTASIYGDENNASGSFSGDAASALGGSLMPGDLSQSGKGNAMTVTVGDVANGESSGNLFALNQDGDDNTVSGTIYGNGNQAGVNQMGNANNASFSQTGDGNNVGISQGGLVSLVVPN